MSHIRAISPLRQQRVQYAQALLRREGDSLLAAAGDLSGCDVLVLGSAVGATLCALATTECRRAESRLPGCRVEAGAADTVLVASSTADAVPGLVRQATLALAKGGTLVMRLPRTGVSDTLRGLLDAARFTDIREVFVHGDRILLAEATPF